MNIKGVGPVSGINYYNKFAINRSEKIEQSRISDRIEISEAAKALKDYGVETLNYDNTKRIGEIKNKILNGTYKIDAKLTAKSMLDVMKGRR